MTTEINLLDCIRQEEAKDLAILTTAARIVVMVTINWTGLRHLMLKIIRDPTGTILSQLLQVPGGIVLETELWGTELETLQHSCLVKPPTVLWTLIMAD